MSTERTFQRSSLKLFWELSVLRCAVIWTHISAIQPACQKPGCFCPRKNSNSRWKIFNWVCALFHMLIATGIINTLCRVLFKVLFISSLVLTTSLCRLRHWDTATLGSWAMIRIPSSLFRNRAPEYCRETDFIWFCFFVLILVISLLNFPLCYVLCWISPPILKVCLFVCLFFNYFFPKYFPVLRSRKQPWLVWLSGLSAGLRT